MLFRKKIERSCAYCALGTQLADNTILCARKGIVDASRPCRKFRYDPTRRIPGRFKPLDFTKYNDEDFSL